MIEEQDREPKLEEVLMFIGIVSMVGMLFACLTHAIINLWR